MYVLLVLKFSTDIYFNDCNIYLFYIHELQFLLRRPKFTYRKIDTIIMSYQQN